MKHKECLTKEGRMVEADFFRKNKKNWVDVRFFGYHVSREYCLEAVSFEKILDDMDRNFKTITEEEDNYLDEIMDCYD